MAIFVLALATLWLPIAIPVFLIFSTASSSFLGIWLYLMFTALVWIWGRKIEQQNQPYAYYGLRGDRQFGLELISGFSLGVVALIGLMQLQVSLGWLSWQPNVNWQGALTAGIFTGLAVGFAEELLFRGLLLTEMIKDFGQGRSLWLNSSFFALTHFIKAEPIAVLLSRSVQFPGLLLLGMTLIWAKNRTNGSLGLAIGLHGGLVAAYYVTGTTNWLQPTNIVPNWITGIDGNPLAGIMGLIFLGAIALALRLSTSQR